MDAKAASQLQALLIGVGGYLQTTVPGGVLYKPLQGSVGDVERAEQFLKVYMGVPQERISKLTASGDGRGSPPEPPELLPTYANMVAALRRIGERAVPGDQVYIHYSGHGGRTSTDFPELKGEGRLDESLVPFDIGTAGASYLRDVELGFLLEEMLDRGLVVTLVLDCCHAGSATRGQAQPRGTDAVDRAIRSETSLVASRAALVARWRGKGRGLAGSDRWLSLGVAGAAERPGLVVLAACRPQEYAFENTFPGEGKSGVLTHWLLDTLRQERPQLTYKLLHDRLLAKIRADFPNQTPMLLGDGSRVVFGFDHRVPQYAVPVLEVEAGGKTVMLATGKLEGVRADSEFAVYPAGVELDREDGWIARLKIDSAGLGPSQSRARIDETRRPPVAQATIEPGALAVLLDPGSIDLKSGIALRERDDLPGAIRQGPALAAVEEQVERGGGFLYLAKVGERIHFYVAVDAQGCFEILDASELPVPHIQPALPIANPDSAVRVVQRLVHLTKFRNIAQIDVPDPSRKAPIGIAATLWRTQPGFHYGDVPVPEPFTVRGNLAEIEEGDWFLLQLENETSREVDITILNLRPDWGIKQLYPASDGGSLPGLRQRWNFAEKIAVQGHLPEGYTEAVDILKIFATHRATNFRWLELPALDDPPLAPPTQRSGDPLEHLLRTLAVDAPAMRTFRQGDVGALEWATAQVEIRVRRRGATA